MIDAAAPESKLTMSVQEMAYQLGIGGNYRVIADKLPDWLNKQAGKTYYF